MTIMEFVEKYKNLNSDKAKEQMVNSHIKRKYCPVLEKRMILQMMLDNSVTTAESGIKFIDMMTSRINYTLAMIALYTDLKIDRKDTDGSNMNYECYDALIESGVIAEICEAIGEQEMKEFSSVNSTLISNFDRSEGNLEAYVGRVVTEFKQRVDDIVSMVSDPNKLVGLMETFKELGDGLNGQFDNISG